MKQFSFEKLIVWQKARELSKSIYRTTKLYPDDKRFGLTSQMRHCAISISSNIAEGSGRQTNNDQARFTVNAYGSALELLNQSIVSHDLELLSNDDYLTIRESLTEISAMLNALHKSLINT